MLDDELDLLDDGGVDLAHGWVVGGSDFGAEAGLAGFFEDVEEEQFFADGAGGVFGDVEAAKEELEPKLIAL